MSESLRISVAQCVSVVGRVDESLALADRLCEQFEALDISLLLHPCAGRILVSEGPEQSEVRRAQDELFEIGSRLAATTGMTYAVANPIGFSGEDYYPGNSWIVRPDGAFARSPDAVFSNEPAPSLVSLSVPERLCVETW